MVKIIDERPTKDPSDKPNPEHATFRAGDETSRRLQVIRIGLLGCGTVGGAVARRITKANKALEGRGLRLELVRSLVRDTKKARRDIPPSLQLTDDANLFLAERYDVVIEALGGLDAPRALINRLLAAGVPVVTANKEVVAAHGDGFAEAARLGGTRIRFEAAAIPGVRFLETIARPNVAGDVAEFAGVLNGASQFILSSIENDGLSFDAALHRAVVLGLAEPDASRDLKGLDAADKLRLILRELGLETAEAIAPATTAVDAITPQIVADARRLAGRIRQVALARNQGDTLEAYVGPAWVAEGHAFAKLASVENSVTFRDAAGTRTQYVGAGAGPDVTAQALLNDVVAIATEPASIVDTAHRNPLRRRVCANIRTPWFVYASFRRDATNPSRVSELLASAGVLFRRFESPPPAGGVERVVGITFPQDASTVHEASKTIVDVAGGAVWAIPAIEDSTHG